MSSRNMQLSHLKGLIFYFTPTRTFPLLTTRDTDVSRRPKSMELKDVFHETERKTIQNYLYSSFGSGTNSYTVY